MKKVHSEKLVERIILSGAAVLLTAVELYLYTLPGLRLLPKKRRTTVDGVATIKEAAAACRWTGLQGWGLVAYAQNLAARKFTYSRRNPWDSPARAFKRGMGYCQQQALALKMIYDRSGICSKPVFALKCRFPPKVVHGIPESESISPHTWLKVTVDGESRFVCPESVTNRPGIVHFEILSEVRTLYPWMRPFSHLGSVIENVKRDRRARTRMSRMNG